jgi:hypothetical protein
MAANHLLPFNFIPIITFRSSDHYNARNVRNYTILLFTYYFTQPMNLNPICCRLEAFCNILDYLKQHFNILDYLKQHFKTTFHLQPEEQTGKQFLISKTLFKKMANITVLFNNFRTYWNIYIFNAYLNIFIYSGPNF